jgi:hypothetical protein
VDRIVHIIMFQSGRSVEKTYRESECPPRPVLTLDGRLKLFGEIGRYVVSLHKVPSLKDPSQKDPSHNSPARKDLIT